MRCSSCEGGIAGAAPICRRLTPAPPRNCSTRHSDTTVSTTAAAASPTTRAAAYRAGAALQQAAAVAREGATGQLRHAGLDRLVQSRTQAAHGVEGREAELWAAAAGQTVAAAQTLGGRELVAVVVVLAGVKLLLIREQVRSGMAMAMAVATARRTLSSAVWMLSLK
jgi:hypothetical protein